MSVLVNRCLNKNSYKTLYFKTETGNAHGLLSSVKRKHQVDGIIRLLPEDFSAISTDAPYLTHFNIQHCDHHLGKRYLIVSINQLGFFDGQTEQQPILDPGPSVLVECVGVRNNLKYEDLVEADFKYSLSGISNVGALKSSILSRYKKSLAHLSDQEKLSLGVSTTMLRILQWQKDDWAVLQ